MLTAQEFRDRLGVDNYTMAFLHSRKIVPEPIKVGGEMRWRVEDVELFVEYLLERLDYRERGLDPDAPDGPPPPVYSTGDPRMDVREVAQQNRERERQAKSKTLAAGSKPIAPQEKITLPEPTSKPNKVEG